MAKIDIKRKLKGELMDELDSLTMDISRSFLGGYQSSPLNIMPNSGIMSRALNSALAITPTNTQKTLAYIQNSTAYGYELYKDALVNINTLNNTLSTAGIYINKDGKKIDIATDFTPKITNIATSLLYVVQDVVTDETKRIANEAITKILELPDPKYFTSYITTYLGKWFNSDEFKKSTTEILGIGKSIIDSSKNILNSSMETKDSEEESKKIVQRKQSKLLDKVTYFCYAKVPVIGNWVSEKSKMITENATMISSYAAMGPDWVSDRMNKYIEEGIDEVEDWVDNQVYWVDRQKKRIYEIVAQSITDEAIKQCKILIERAKKLISKETKIKIEQAELKAKLAVVSAAAKVCSKFGIPVPSFDDMINKAEQIKKAGLLKQISEMSVKMLKNIFNNQISDETAQDMVNSATIDQLLEMTDDEIRALSPEMQCEMYKLLINKQSELLEKDEKLKSQIAETNKKRNELIKQINYLQKIDYLDDESAPEEEQEAFLIERDLYSVIDELEDLNNEHIETYIKPLEKINHVITILLENEEVKKLAQSETTKANNTNTNIINNTQNTPTEQTTNKEKTTDTNKNTNNTSTSTTTQSSNTSTGTSTNATEEKPPQYYTPDQMDKFFEQALKEGDIVDGMLISRDTKDSGYATSDEIKDAMSQLGGMANSMIDLVDSIKAYKSRLEHGGVSNSEVGPWNKAEAIRVRAADYVTKINNSIFALKDENVEGDLTELIKKYKTDGDEIMKLAKKAGLR